MAPATRALPEAAVQAQAGLGPALRVLPGAALQARALALRLAAPDGQILAAPDERTLTEIVRNVAGVQRQLLTALTAVVGDAEHADAPGKQAEGTSEQAGGPSEQAGGPSEQPEGPSEQPEGPSEMLASLTQIASDAREFRPIFQRLLAGTTAARAVAATAETAAPVAVAVAGAAVADEAAVAGASAAGAAAGTALTAALTAAGVAAVAAMVIQAGNRAVRERDRLAYARLIEWRTATEASILTNAEDLLRRTRDIVYGRLCFALGADNDLDRQFRLRQAIEDVRRDRALMLETLRDDHLG
jgi:hypothetical protein